MNHRNLLNESYPLSQHHIDFYRTNGFIKLKNVLEADTLKHYGQLISQKVVENTQNVNTLSDRDTYGKAFLQIFNLWREDKDIKKFIFSKRLAKIATQLMEVKGVRMYHDQALFKESNGGYTPWHADQYYWPLSSELKNLGSDLGGAVKGFKDGMKQGESDETPEQVAQATATEKTAETIDVEAKAKS